MVELQPEYLNTALLTAAVVLQIVLVRSDHRDLARQLLEVRLLIARLHPHEGEAGTGAGCRDTEPSARRG